ncbi:ankyrin repeat-containing protein ITN1-like isoform X2 [Triticum urartu]|uniref:ankyrin repeat-containing protein ITN1-like isoform X2 n=1 Tax=Triticum urartu TaxID=4572 RepID=UPI002043020B|nr:ankyrin repeat-containing protein ITN1-like isoform X2 [Triticum urartu]
MADNTSTTSSLEGRREELWMDQHLLEAATSGDSALMKAMELQNPSMLLRTTPAGNTCLHISSIHGHEAFCTDVVALEASLLTTVNLDRETPLLAAVKSGFVILASVLLRLYRERRLSKAILEKDIDGCNALHHAIRSGHRKLALELIEAEPALSTHVNRMNESPMYIAAMRNFTDISENLLEIPDSAHMGPWGQNTLQAAVKNGNAGLAKRIMETRPGLAKEADNNGCTPLSSAVYRGLVDVARVLLEHDCSLGYEVPSNDACWTSLHVAVYDDQVEFTEFILRTPQLRKLINMQDSNGKTALHLAVEKFNPKMVVALLSHDDIDTTVLDNKGVTPAWVLAHVIDHAKTLNWNEVSMLMVRADPRDANTLYNLHTQIKHKATLESRKEAKSLTQTYTSNTSLVAILITTVTFAAAFTLPGGYSNDAGSEGLPIMSRKFAFQTFLISDVLAMCSSFAVAFICIIARWGDYEFLIYYISATKKLMWFAYVATTTAFSTGLYTVLAPHLHWLATAICLVVALLPILTKLLGEWPVWKLRLRLGKAFNSDLLDMV